MSSLIEKGWQRPGLINFLLLPLSFLYGIAMKIRGFLYQWGLKSSHALGVPVIVVGNLSVGGTGKTPLVIALVQALRAKGYKPGVISRGYGANPPFTPFAVDDHSEAVQVGDEPLLIYQRCNVPVVVGPDRILNSGVLIDKYGCNVIVSDDGFQHLRLQRDVDIVVVDGQRGLGNGWCLPAGPLREFRSALHRADMLIINGGGKDDIRNLPKNALPSFHMQVKSQPLATTKKSAENVFAVAGLGNPDRFFNLLRGKEIQFSEKPYPDHHQFSQQDFSFADEESVIYMTEKDAVKCDAISIPGQVIVVSIEADLPESFYTFIFDQLKANEN